MIQDTTRPVRPVRPASLTARMPRSGQTSLPRPPRRKYRRLIAGRCPEAQARRLSRARIPPSVLSPSATLLSSRGSDADWTFKVSDARVELRISWTRTTTRLVSAHDTASFSEPAT